MTTTLHQLSRALLVKAPPPYCYKCRKYYGTINLNDDPEHPVYVCSCQNYGGPVWVMPPRIERKAPESETEVKAEVKQVKSNRVIKHNGDVEIDYNEFDCVTVRCNACGNLASLYPVILLSISRKGAHYTCKCGNDNLGKWKDWVRSKFGDFSYLFHKEKKIKAK